MFRARIAGLRLFRGYATATGPHSLVFIEHSKGVIDSGSLSAVSAATQLGGQVTGLVVGGPEHIRNAVDSAKR